MDINIFIIIIQFITVLITLVYVILISKTITSHKNINQKILFNEIIKQERELRIKLNEYREEIQMRRENSKNFGEIGLDYETEFGYDLTSYKERIDEMRNGCYQS